jgi:hypothetical protein
MGDKHTEVKKERDGYLEFLKGLQNEGQVTAEEKAAAEKELEEVIVLGNRLMSGSKGGGYGDGRT